MSFKLKRRDGGEPTDENIEAESGENGKKPQKSYSVVVYVWLLFAVVIIVVLMSYFAQQRNNSQALFALREQHNQVTSQAFENIEKLQEKNMEIMKDNNALTEKVSELEKKIEELENAADEAKEKIGLLEAENKAISDLSSLQSAITANNTEKAKTLIDTLNKEKDNLPANGKNAFDTLKSAYDELVKSLETEGTKE